jgi:hypothetical protein
MSLNNQGPLIKLTKFLIQKNKVVKLDILKGHEFL